MSRIYTKEQHEWFAAFIPGHKQDEIAAAFKARFGREISKSSIKKLQNKSSYTKRNIKRKKALERATMVTGACRFFETKQRRKNSKRSRRTDKQNI